MSEIVEGYVDPTVLEIRYHAGDRIRVKRWVDAQKPVLQALQRGISVSWEPRDQDAWRQAKYGDRGWVLAREYVYIPWARVVWLWHAHECSVSGL